MIGDFDSILSDEEAQRLESAFLALGATSANGERPVSEAEERAWFAHLQQGDARGQRALARRLTGKVNVAQLTAALQALVRETPGVDVRYVFEDENGLVKRPAGSAPLPVSLRQVADEQHAMGCLLQAQATPFELESEAPLRCLLLLMPGDAVILGVVLHDIGGNAAVAPPAGDAVRSLQRGCDASVFRGGAGRAGGNLGAAAAVGAPCGLAAGLPQPGAAR